MLWLSSALTDKAIYFCILTNKLSVHHTSIHMCVLTLMRILPCRLWGLGNVLESLLRISPTSSLSAKISRRYWAIFFCCWMLQWFSMDRITGNLKEKNINVHTQVSIGYMKNLSTLRKCVSNAADGLRWVWITSQTVLPFLTFNQENSEEINDKHTAA